MTVGSLPPEWGGPTRGGVATFHASLLDGLQRRDDVDLLGVVAPAASSPQATVPVLARPADVPHASFYERALERLRPDVVLMNHVANTVGVTHARLAAPVPAVGVVHSWHNVTFRAGEHAEHARRLTVEALAGLPAVVTPSSHCRNEGRRLGFAYPGIAETIHYPLQPLYLDGDIDVRAGARDGIAYLGTLSARKNPGALVEAAAMLPDLRFVLAGEGELRDSLRAAAVELTVSDRVTVAALPEARHLEHVRDLLRRSQALCVPSESESFGIVYIEALACGTPVVGFGPTVREIRDVMGIEIGVPLDDPDPRAIAAAIEWTLARDWDRDALRRAAVASFGLDAATERYVGVLARALTASPPTGADR